MLFKELMVFLKATAPFSIAANLILVVILGVLGLSLFLMKNRTKGKRIGGVICLVMSGLALIGSVSTWLVSTFVF